MFSRLAEAFQSSHGPYIDKQNKYFDAIPNIIPSATSGLKGFDSAIQSVDTVGIQYQDYAVKNPNEIFKSDVSPNLEALVRQCASSDIDRLIATKNPCIKWFSCS